jgi:hypothetical protein
LKNCLFVHRRYPQTRILKEKTRPTSPFRHYHSSHAPDALCSPQTHSTNGPSEAERTMRCARRIPACSSRSKPQDAGETQAPKVAAPRHSGMAQHLALGVGSITDSYSRKDVRTVRRANNPRSFQRYPPRAAMCSARPAFIDDRAPVGQDDRKGCRKRSLVAIATKFRAFADQGRRGISPSATRQTQGVISGRASIMSARACS